MGLASGFIPRSGTALRSWGVSDTGIEFALSLAETVLVARAPDVVGYGWLELIIGVITPVKFLIDMSGNERRVTEDSMSQRDVERTLGRLLTDEGFREEFFRDPARACLGVGLELAPHEVEALLRLPRPALAHLAARLDGRICRLHLQRSEIARRID